MDYWLGCENVPCLTKMVRDNRKASNELHAAACLSGHESVREEVVVSGPPWRAVSGPGRKVSFCVNAENKGVRWYLAGAGVVSAESAGVISRVL